MHIADDAADGQQARLLRLLAGRRSIRRYTPQPVSRDQLDALLQAALDAPSAHNRQPARFLVITAATVKARLAAAMGARLRADRGRDGDPLDVIDADVARSTARITGSPVVILACLTMVDMDGYPDAARQGAEYLMAVQSMAMAVQNLLVAAHAGGLGACWMCAPLFCPDTVAAAVALPEGWQPQAMITLGHPANAGKPRRRRDIAEIARFADDDR
jgi:F420 biosynthesis protein FbiB-like protein